MNDEIALEVFGILTEYEIKTLGDQKEFCREVAEWYQGKIAQFNIRSKSLQMVLFTTHAALGINKETTQSLIDEAIEIEHLREEQPNA